MLKRVTERYATQSPGVMGLRRAWRVVDYRPGDPSMVWDKAQRLWVHPTGRERCKHKATGPCRYCGTRAVASDPSAARTDADAFDALLRSLYERSELSLFALDAWVAEGLTFNKLLDRVRGTIEAEIMHDDLFAVWMAVQYSAPTATLREFAGVLKPPQAKAIRKGEGSMHEAMGQGDYPWDCEVSGHVAAYDESTCRACGRIVTPPMEPASPKPRCDHDWDYRGTDQRDGSVYALCSLCGETARQGRVNAISAPPPPLPREHRTRCAVLNYPDSPHPRVMIAHENIASFADDPTRKGTYGNAIIIRTRDGREYRGDYVGAKPGMTQRARAFNNGTSAPGSVISFTDDIHPVDVV